MLQNMKTKLAPIAGTALVLVSSAAPVFAAGTADAAVLSGFTGIADNVIATITAVAPVVLGIFGVFVAWKFGKKIFNKAS